jgi:hypothetical protein
MQPASFSLSTVRLDRGEVIHPAFNKQIAETPEVPEQLISRFVDRAGNESATNT